MHKIPVALLLDVNENGLRSREIKAPAGREHASVTQALTDVTAALSSWLTKI